MNIYYLKIQYKKSKIKIYNNKIKFNHSINKCNKLCKSINPIYCPNCLYSIISDPYLNSNISDYILYNDNNDYYHVLRNSINNNPNYYNNYYNNQYEVNYMQEIYYNQMYDNYVNINDYNQENYEIEESNYDFENSTIQSNSLSDITLDKFLKNNKNIKDKTIKDNDEHVSLDEQVSLDKNVSLDEKKINNNNEKDEIILNSENTNLKKNYDQNKKISLENNDKILKKNEDNNIKNNNIEDKVLEEDKEILLDNIENVENNVLDNIQENKQYLKKQRKKQRRKQKKIEEKKKNQEKDNEELELINKAINSNKLELLEKIKKLNLDKNQYDLIKNLSYAELNEKMSNPIIYDMGFRLFKTYKENKNEFSNMSFFDKMLEEDLKILEKKNKDLVDNIKDYLNEDNFNKFYFYSVYELMYYEKLNILIKNKSKLYDTKNFNISYDFTFYEEINDDRINHFFSSYMEEIYLKPYIKIKKEQLKDKYDNYEKNLFKNKNIVDFEEKLLILNNKKKKLKGNIIFGRRGGIIFDKDNNCDKIYF
jgi:hypothetical protein